MRKIAISLFGIAIAFQTMAIDGYNSSLRIGMSKQELIDSNICNFRDKEFRTLRCNDFLFKGEKANLETYFIKGGVGLDYVSVIIPSGVTVDDVYQNLVTKYGKPNKIKTVEEHGGKYEKFIFDNYHAALRKITQDNGDIYGTLYFRSDYYLKQINPDKE
ncbi:hypothetical protein [Aeromonas veronii]|uniref:hypothetical protein n=1 Tax=Aeromonas veronii TaxID=654 RepID=UPI0013026695|nr:hypothetical protein [Aeromonas veronii]KAE9637396.1 hypothetical protein GO977_00115 [Aeromonas veronii]